ncbi:MAG: TRAP transporter small permease [Calditrichaceae bacterium]|jgi:TRAP-type C4-dicarboxylate transport system permease small subunit
MEKLTHNITKVLSIILITLMSVMVIDVTWQVFTRFILKDPSGFTEELAGFLLIWIGLLGASYAYRTKAHLGIDVLTAKFSGFKKLASEILVSVIVFLFALFLLVIGGLRLVDITFTLKQISPAIGIPMGYIYLVLPVTGILFMYYAVVFILESVKENKPKGRVF